MALPRSGVPSGTVVMANLEACHGNNSTTVSGIIRLLLECGLGIRRSWRCRRIASIQVTSRAMCRAAGKQPRGSGDARLVGPM
jgi:hypothetical protein